MIELYKNFEFSKDLLLIRITKAESGQNIVIANKFLEIQSSKKAFEQKDEICKEILKILNNQIISGHINKIESNKFSIYIDIGECQGVRSFDDKFEVVNKDTILGVLSIGSNSCGLTIISGVMPALGDEVKMIIQ